MKRQPIKPANARSGSLLQARYLLLQAQERHTDAASEGYKALHRIWIYLRDEYDSCR